MGRSVTCDGCGQAISGSHEEIGLVLKGDYCDTCSPLASDLLHQVHGLHVDVANEFRAGLSSILDEFEKENPGFMVPDYRFMT